MNQFPVNSLYSSNSGTSQTTPFVEFFIDRDPTIYDVNFPIQKRWFNTLTNVEYILISFNNVGGFLTANWQPISTGPDSNIVEHYSLVGGPDHTITSVAPNTAGLVLTSNGNSVDPSFQAIPGPVVTDHYALIGGPGNTITSVSPSTAGLVLTSNGTGSDPSFQAANLNSKSQYATFLVNPTPGLGTHTTIQSAISSASSGDTIWIYRGTYTENLTFPVDGITLASYQGTAIIIGKMTYTLSNFIRLIGISFQTNSDYILNNSGIGNVLFLNCNLNCTNNTGILSTAGAIVANNTTGNLGETGISYFNCTSTNVLINYCSFENSSGSATASTFSGTSVLRIKSSRIVFSISVLSGTSAQIDNSVLLCLLSSPFTPIIFDGGVSSRVLSCYIISYGSPSIIVSSLSQTLVVTNCTFECGAASVINGLGSVYNSNNNFISTSKVVNPTTSSNFAAQGVVGSNISAGAIGEQISSFTATSTPTTGVATTLVSIALTPGIWDISILTYFSSSATLTVCQSGISTTTNSLAGTVSGDSYIANFGFTSTAQGLSIPAYRQVVSANTTYYLVVNTTFTGTINVAGRISATRVG